MVVGEGRGAWGSTVGSVVGRTLQKREKPPSVGERTTASPLQPHCTALLVESRMIQLLQTAPSNVIGAHTLDIRRCDHDRSRDLST